MEMPAFGRSAEVYPSAGWYRPSISPANSTAWRTLWQHSPRGLSDGRARAVDLSLAALLPFFPGGQAHLCFYCYFSDEGSGVAYMTTMMTGWILGA